jgi:hypothetical protein
MSEFIPPRGTELVEASFDDPSAKLSRSAGSGQHPQQKKTDKFW